MSKAKNYLVIESHAFDRDGNRHYFTHFVDLKDSKALFEDMNFLFRHVTNFCGKEGQVVDKVYFCDTRMTNW